MLLWSLTPLTAWGRSWLS